jgi:hypothetical protein
VTTCDCSTPLKIEASCYFHVKASADLFADISPNGHGSPTEEQLRWIGAINERRRRDGWRAAWLAVHHPQDDVDYEKWRGVRYVMSIGHLRGELSV